MSAEETDDVSYAVYTGIDFFLIDADDALITLFGVIEAFESKSFSQAFHHLRLVFRIANEGDAIEQTSEHVFDRRR